MFALPTFFAICGCAAKQAPLPTTGYKAVVWEKGKEAKVKSQASCEQVREVVSSIVEHSDDMLKLIVDDQLIKELKEECTCLEVTLASPVTARFGKQETTFSCLLVPINTDANVHSIVFYIGDGKTYFTPPGVSTQGKADLNHLAELLCVTFGSKE